MSRSEFISALLMTVIEIRNCVRASLSNGGIQTVCFMRHKILKRAVMESLRLKILFAPSCEALCFAHSAPVVET